jgi:MinD superfamily P-loop ATPase
MKITIASGKGGTGKTTLATNLASYLANQHTVVLTDLDVEEPNSGLFVQGDPLLEEDKFKMIPEWNGSCSLCGLCQDVCQFHAVLKLGSEIMVFPQLCHSCYACSELCPDSALPMKASKIGTLRHLQTDSLTFVESRLDIGQEQAVPLINQTNRYLKEKFPDVPLIIIDAPPGTSCPVIATTKDADFVILVTEPTPFGLHDLRLAVKTMQILKKKFAVVINREGIGNDDVEIYCRQEKIPILARIPNDRRIAERYSQGQLVYSSVPEFLAQLMRIDDYIKELTRKRK